MARNLPQVAAISKVTGRDSGNKRQLVASKNWSIMQKQGSIVPSGADTTAGAGLSEAGKRSHAAAQQTQYAPFADQLQVKKVEGRGTQPQFYPLSISANSPLASRRAAVEAKPHAVISASSPRQKRSVEMMPAALAEGTRAEF